MLVVPALRHRRPEGRNSEMHPEILVGRKVIKANGAMPEVDYANLATLFQHELLGFREENMPATAIYYGAAKPPAWMKAIDYRSRRLGRTIHVNTYHEDEDFPGQVDSVVLMERLIRRAAIYSLARANELPPFSKDEMNQTATTIALGGLTLALAASGDAEIAIAPGALALGVGMGLRDRRLAQFNSMVEPTVRELLPLHREDIVFPNRTS